MALKSVNHILDSLKQQAQWQEPPIHRLVKCWAEVVGDMVATHTRPVSIQRDVLWVATSSAAWAQNLTFGRQNLLKKLNQKLPTPLVDIRFSTAEWKRSPIIIKRQDTSPQAHPSYMGENSHSEVESKPERKTPHATFTNWAKVMQERSQNLPLCPRCECPTPAGELQRWSVCSLCAAKQFSDLSH
jgi:predicted nucleic acid-binding Zn ribbon protein